jgi:hypothetical protein
MPIQQITSGVIADGAVVATDIANGTVTGPKLGANSVSSNNIVSVLGSAITSNTIANSAIQTGAVENYLNSQSLNLGMRNRIINGNMAINQRGVTSGITTGYFVDRWTLSGCSTSATLTSSLPTGFSAGISITATSGNPIAIQKVEAKNCSDLSGRNVTLSFYAKNISNATILYASLGYPTTTPDDFNATTTISEQNLGTLTSDWVRYTYTWTNLPSGAVNGLGLNLLCAGTGTFSMGITGVQLEIGSQATPFEFRQHTTELALCQRYFYKASGTEVAYGALYDQSATRSIVTVPYHVTMRTNPSTTITYGSGTANSIFGTQDTCYVYVTISSGSSSYLTAFAASAEL